jgi:hypothetical protein
MSLIAQAPFTGCKHPLPLRDQFGQIKTVGTRCSSRNCPVHKAIPDYNNFQELCKYGEECQMRNDEFCPCVRMHKREDVFNMIHKIKIVKPEAMLHFLETMTVHQFRHYFKESEQWDYFNKYRMIEIYRPIRSDFFEQQDREKQLREQQLKEQQQKEQQLKEQQLREQQQLQEQQQLREQQMRMIQQSMFQNMFQQMIASQAASRMMSFPQLMNPLMFAPAPMSVPVSAPTFAPMSAPTFASEPMPTSAPVSATTFALAAPLLPSPPVAREFPASNSRRARSRSRSREPVREKKEQRRYYEY